FDINSENYIPGKKPHVHFVDSLISGYLLDSVRIKIAWSDTARGGVKGAIKKFVFDFNGTGNFSYSINANQSNPFVFTRVFNPQSNIIRVKGVDNENGTSRIDSVWLEIKRSNPQIISIDAPSVVARGTSFYIRIKATDTGGVITSYLWAVEENTFSRVTDSASLKLSFDKPGKKTIRVKVKDNKKIESPQRIITINVF
ncbi:MAG: hypothetical protein GX640_19455, partial [Fibrobacter sp.]|nr:hypothetical protein [Fibrobacter sp.]